VLVASTGVIGVGLKMDRVVPGIQAAARALARGKGSDTAHAIMTTDPFPKEHAVRVQTPRGSFVVGGTAKGSGMIEPNMATMLGFLTTDAQVSPALLRARARRNRPGTRSTPSPSTASARPTTACLRWPPAQSGVAIDDDSYPALLAACAKCPSTRSRHRSRRRGRDQADLASPVRDARDDEDAGWWRARSPTRRW
jgi:hypothetical protein